MEKEMTKKVFISKTKRDQLLGIQNVYIQGNPTETRVKKNP